MANGLDDKTTGDAAVASAGTGAGPAGPGPGKQTLIQSVPDAATAGPTLAGPGKATAGPAAGTPGDAATGGADATSDARQWPTVLPHANRDKAHAITIKKGTAAHGKGKDHVDAVQNAAEVPDIDKPALDDKNKAIVAAIANNREALPDLLSDKYGNAKGGGGVGYMYGGKDPSKPTEVKDVKADATDKASLQKKWVWEEVGSEGGASSVNTYDGMNVTFGKGFAAGGAVESMLTKLFAKDPAIKDMFLDAGVTIVNGKWQLVNTDLGAIEDDKNALHLFEVNPKLLSVFVKMAEDPKFSQTNLDVQWDQLKQGAGKIPDYANTWDEAPTKLAVHLKHWLPGYAWVFNDYSATAGDTLAIVKRFGSLMVAKEGTTQKSGALLVDGKTTWGTVSHLKVLAKGAGFTALSGGAELVTIAKTDVATDTKYAGKLLFPAGQDTYYVTAP